jgi:hypothetical protein
MKNIIQARINVLKINKGKLFKGEKGTYLDVVLIPTPNSTFADYMVVESITKEDRENDVKGTILGNAMELKRNNESAPWNDTKTESDKGGFKDRDFQAGGADGTQRTIHPEDAVIIDDLPF